MSDFNNRTINVNDRMRAKETKKAIGNLTVIGLVILALIILISSATFTVNEHEQAVISRLGQVKKIIVDPQNSFIDEHSELMNAEGAKLQDIAVVKGKGLYFRMPFIDQVDKFDSWLYTYVSDSEPVNTQDKKKYDITMFAQWRISNPGLFKVTHQNVSTASNYLDNLIFPEIIQRINDMRADDFISNKEMLNTALLDAQASINSTIVDGGIEIVDMQVHRTILPAGNLQSTYQRMVANREKVAQQLRAEGDEEYTKVVAAADREARETIAGAIKEAEQIKGEGEAEALGIYAESYSADSDFYGFWRSLQALEKSIGADTTLVLDSSHPLWKDILQWATGEPEAPAEQPAN